MSLFLTHANYIVTISSDDWKEWSVVVESITKGVNNPSHGPRQITTTGSQPPENTLHDYVALFMEELHPGIKPEWYLYKKANLGFRAEVQAQLDSWGYDLTRDMLEEGRAHYIVNMFGCLEATIEALDELHNHNTKDA